MQQSPFARPRKLFRPLLGLTLLGACLMFAACGVTVRNAALSQPSISATPGEPPTRSPIPPVIVPTITPAPSAPTATTVPSAPTNGSMVILTPKSGDVTTVVKVGQIVQAQLPNNRNWVFFNQTVALLAPITPSGVHTSAGVYLWTFRAQASGTTTLHFTGTTPCQAHLACTPLAFTMNFALNVTD